MIEIKITSDKKKVMVESEAEIHGTRRDAIAEMVGAMRSLKKIDKELFRDALHHIVNEDIHEMIDELELEDGGELDD